MLFKILHGDASRISTNITPYHEGYCYVTHNGDFYVDMNDERVKLNAKDAETIMGASLANVLNNNPLEISTSQAVFSAIEAAKDDLNTNLNSRIDDIENDIKTTNEALGDVSQELKNYKTTNDEAVSTNATNIANNKSAIEDIKGDYLTSTDKEQLEDTIDTRVGEIENNFSEYKTEVEERFTEVDTVINNHASDANNPHCVTKEQIGLANVDDTSDIDKPISYATQLALDEKADAEHTHDDLYYTKDELLAMFELITVEDIDEICFEPSQGLAYTLNNNGTGYTLSGLGTCTDTEVYIPSSYNGLPVTTIDVWAFGGCTGLTSITIPNSVTSIGNSVFNGCTGLTSINIPNSVTSIGDFAFSNCKSLTSITIPDSVTSIGSYVFQSCPNLTSITIPDSVTSIGVDVFRECTSLTSINLPNSVTSIGKSVFNGCTSLTSITIPNGVLSIGDYAFQKCTSLTSITIPGSVTSIGFYAFDGCYNLKYVTFTSTKNKWDQISIGSNNTYLTKATISYAQDDGGSSD